MDNHHDELTHRAECAGPDLDYSFVDDQATVGTMSDVHRYAGVELVVPGFGIHPSEALQFRGGMQHLPSTLPYHIRQSIMIYCSAIAEPSRLLGQQDLEIAQLIHARVQQLGGEMSFDNLAPNDMQPLSDSARNISVPPSPIGSEADLHTVSAEFHIKCLYDGCGRPIQSTDTRDIASHFEAYHHRDYAEADNNRADDGQSETLLCKWEHCPRETQLLKRSLVKHIKHAHLRQGRRVSCINSALGCLKTFSRRDAMVRHAKDCRWGRPADNVSSVSQTE